MMISTWANYGWEWKDYYYSWFEFGLTKPQWDFRLDPVNPVISPVACFLMTPPTTADRPFRGRRELNWSNINTPSTIGPTIVYLLYIFGYTWHSLFFPFRSISKLYQKWRTQCDSSTLPSAYWSSCVVSTSYPINRRPRCRWWNWDWLMGVGMFSSHSHWGTIGGA